MAKKKKRKKKRVSRSIVVSHLEHISSKVFDDYQGPITELIQGNHGVYALYRREKLYYIGLATDLKKRLEHHLKDRHKGKWTQFNLYLIRKVDRIREVEALLLRIADPEGNRVRGKLKKSKSLARELDAAIKREQDEKRRVVFGRKKSGKAKKNKKKTKASDRPLYGVFPGGKMIYATYKGVDYKAWVRRMGIISFNGKLYESPSGAGLAIRKKSTNGWAFWKYKDKKGNLRWLREVR